MTVAELSRSMSTHEEDMWLARAHTEPFLARRVEASLAQIAMLLHNINVKKDKAKPLQDFMLFKPAKPPVENVDDEVMKVFSNLLDKKA